MSRVLEGAVPIHVWGRTIPDGALAQLRRIAAQPYVVERVAAMPDLHVASGIAVGTVFATSHVLVPEALGGDLGCGMSAVRFDFPAASLSRRALERILQGLAARIPVGDARHRGKRTLPDGLLAPALSTGALQRARERLGPAQLGTLGGGNHFVELDRDAGGDLWLLVHSGSRGLGGAVAEHHCRAAEREGIGELPGLPLVSAAGQAFQGDLGFVLAFAAANRRAIVDAAAQVLAEAGVAAPPERRIDLHHNFVAEEEHGGRALLVHRKGAIAAPAGIEALIPGSMGTASYVVVGLGEASSFRSGSHGAGRLLTRREARERIAPGRLAATLRRVVHDASLARALVEEAPEAYRDIGAVLEDEADLVRPVLRLEPIAVLKG